MTDRYYLRPNVVIQPLVDRWYAWSHLVPPATLGLNHLQRHLRIMDSYIEDPRAHAAALEDPLMEGGPFLDLGGERVDDVIALAAQIRHRRAGLLTLARAFQELSALLRETARGYALDDLYEQIPPVLRGYVELFYDIEHHASFRVMEPLIYNSPHFDPSGQSLVLFEMEGDSRPFVLSTPWFDGPDRLHLDIPFASPRVDALARLKWEPMTLGAIQEALGTSPAQTVLLSGFLTTTPPPTVARYDRAELRWRYFGHACVVVEAGGVSVMTDPLVAYHVAGDVRRYTFHDLPEHIDCVLITHAHQDHTMIETLLQLRHRIGTVAVPRSGGGSLQDPSLKLLLKGIGFENVVEVQEFDEIDLGPLVVRAMPFMGEHADLDIRAKVTYLVEAGDRKLFFGADTCNVEPAVYDRVHEAVGDIDTVFLGMECDGAPLDWLYGPLMMAPHTRDSWRMAQSRTLSGSDSARAIDLVQSLGAKTAYVYSMGQEPWLRYLLSLAYQPDSVPIVESDKLISWCRGAGIDSDRLFGMREMCIP